MEKISFQVNEVLPMLTQLAKVVSTKNTMPILSKILFEVDGDILHAIASDGETWLKMNYQLNSSMGNYSFCVESKDFVSALSNLSGYELTLDIDLDGKKVCGNYGAGVFNMPLFDCNEYPKPHMEVEKDENGNTISTTITINAQELYRLLTLSEFATANDELRPQMNGIHFDVDSDKITCAATDGRKLVRLINNMENNVQEQKGLTLPKKTTHSIISLIAKNDNDIIIYFNSSMVLVSCSDFELVARLAEGRYPNYNGVIPQEFKQVVSIDKSALISAIKRILTFGNSNNELIALHFKTGMVDAEAEDIDFSKSARESIMCDYNGEEMRIGFQGTFLMQVVNSIQGEGISMGLIEPSRPIVLKPVFEGAGKSQISMLMPILLN